MKTRSRDIEQEIVEQLWIGCGEQLESLSPNLWNQKVVPVLLRMLAKERELKEYYQDLFNMKS